MYKQLIKNSSIITLIFIGFISCEKEYDIPESNNFSDAVAVASGNTRIQKGGLTSFADLSRGVTKRTWTIPESAYISNLDGKQPGDLDLIHVVFEEAGDYNVNLKSEFEVDSVNIDKTFNVKVLDYVQSKIEVTAVEADFFEQTENQITMYEGGTIHFKDVSLGSPNRRLWTFDGGDPESAGGISLDEDELVKSIAVSYPSIGQYDVSLVTWRQYPTGEKDTLRLENFVNVIENLEPPTLSSVIENENGIIQLSYNLPLKITSESTSNFSLLVDNQQTTITSVVLNPDDNRILEITPSININSKSTALLTYDGMGGIMRLNDVAIPAFNNETVSLFLPNIADNNIYGFEDGGTGWEQTRPWDNIGQISFTNEQVASGSYSMRMEATEDGNWTKAWSKNKESNTENSNFTLETGQNVTLEFKIWIDPSYTATNIQPHIWNAGNWVSEGFWTSIEGLERGKWITINKELVKVWTVPATAEYFLSFRFNKKGVIYIDDVRIFEPE